VQILVGGDSVLDDGLCLLCTERCVDGRCSHGGNVVSRWGIRGEDFFFEVPGGEGQVERCVYLGKWLGAFRQEIPWVGMMARAVLVCCSRFSMPGSTS
jgi:hypothetical protein